MNILSRDKNYSKNIPHSWSRQTCSYCSVPLHGNVLLEQLNDIVIKR